MEMKMKKIWKLLAFSATLSIGSAYADGGLMQLVAYGAQDVYLTDKPQITFDRKQYHANKLLHNSDKSLERKTHQAHHFSELTRKRDHGY
jgi:hypothetical protein